MSFSFNKPCDCRSESWPAIGRDCPVSCRDALRGASRPGVEALLAGTRGEPGRPWLCPRFGSLTPPGGPLRQILVGHSHRVEAVAFLPAGRRALSGSRDATLRLWDLETGETLQTLEGHTDGVSAVAVLADGSRALSGSDDHTLRLWDLETGARLAEFTADAAISCGALARDDLIVAGSADGRIHILEIREP